MIGFFTPRYIKEGREMLKAARKMLHYKRDLLATGDLASIGTEMERMEKALKERSRDAVSASAKRLDAIFGTHFPASKDSAIRENVEVFLVAIVIAVGVRSYFLQPFTIPTGSMQPTLNGIIATVTDQPAPNFFKRTFDSIWLGRNYVDAVSKEEDTVRRITPVTYLRFFTYTKIECDRQTFTVPAPIDKVGNDFHVLPGRPLKAGEIVARGHVDTGDHVFVDKVSYNVRPPKRGEVFVFNTLGIPTRENQQHPGGPSQFYIKRLAGLPGDLLRIDSPDLFLNGARATGTPFERVMSCINGYRGYSNDPRFTYLNNPEATLRLPQQRYFALGDNSYNSSDSRDWGTVPEQNIMGRGMFVYWPFSPHFGFIR